MGTSSLGKYTVLLFSVNDFSLIWLLWPAEPCSTACISCEIPCCFMPQGVYTANHSVWNTQASSFLPFQFFFSHGFSRGNLPDSGEQSALSELHGPVLPSITALTLCIVIVYSSVSSDYGLSQKLIGPWRRTFASRLKFVPLVPGTKRMLEEYLLNERIMSLQLRALKTGL